MPPQPTDAQFDQDNDSLYVLPLRILPIKAPALKRARIIKDARLDSVLELFSSEESGSGQMYLSDINEDTFNVDTETLDADLGILHRVAELPSFDVFSLRICLREQEIDIKSNQYLSLSPAKREELKAYMKAFTLPLIREVYGHEDIEANEASDIIKLFAHPDPGVAAQRLKKLAEQLQIKVRDIPNFLEDFSDIYLSLAFFQQQLDEIAPIIIDFFGEMRELSTNWQMRHDHRLMQTCEQLENAMNHLITRVTGRFESFYLNTDAMWENVTAERFRNVETLIKSNHKTVGGVLCGLGSKLNVWKANFPDRSIGGPVRRAELIMSDLVHGMDKILKLEASGATVTDLQPA